MARQSGKTAPAGGLPPGALNSDTAWPKGQERVIATLSVYDLGGRFGWAVKTLPINARTNRAYGMTVESGRVVTMGNPGTRIVTLYITEKRKAALQKYIDLHAAGQQDAGAIRDRIGSRRAEGQIRRARGEYSWHWSY